MDDYKRNYVAAFATLQELKLPLKKIKKNGGAVLKAGVEAPFGVPLELDEAVVTVQCMESPEKLEIPEAFKILGDMLVHGGANQSEGIYRKPGSVVRMKAAVECCKEKGRFPELGQPETGGMHVNDVAGLQKKFIRDMPVGLLHDIKPILLMLQHPSNKMTHAELITSYNASLRLLPSRRHFDFVLNFFSWLHRLGSDSAKTKMDIANLAVVIGHNLFHGFGDDATSLDEVPLLNKATEFLIQNISQMAGRTAELAHFAHRMTDTEVDTKFKKLTTFGMARRRSLHMVMNVTSTVVQAAGAAGAAMGTAVGRAGRMIRRNSLHAPANLKDLAAETEAAAAASVSEQTVPDGSKRRRRNSLSRKGSGSLSVSSDSGSDLSQPDEPLFADQPRSRPRGSSIGGRRSIGSAQTRRTTNGSAQKSTREAASAKGTPGRMIANRSAAKPITPYRSARAGKRLNLRTAPPEAQRDAPTLALRPTVRKTMPLAECNQQFEQMAFRSKLMRSDPHEGENILALELQGTSPQESGMYSQNGESVFLV